MGPSESPDPSSLNSKSGDLEEELKNVTNNLKSLEAQAEKVRRRSRVLLHFHQVLRGFLFMLPFSVLTKRRQIRGGDPSADRQTEGGEMLMSERR